MTVVKPVVTVHAEEAAFLWLLRARAVGAPHFRIGPLARLDTRVDAHLDGLRIAGDAGWEICKEELAWEQPGEIFAAGVIAIESQNRERVEQVLRVGSQDLELASGLVSALGWLTHDVAAEHINNLLRSEVPLLRRVGIAAAAVSRHDPGASLTSALSDAEIVRSRALRAIGELGRTDLLSACVGHLTDENADCRFWAAWSAARLGDPRSIHTLREIAEVGGSDAGRACDLAARRLGHEEALSWQKHLATRPGCGRLAIHAAGAIGDPALVPWLIDMMRIDEFARPAGEALSFITGLDLALEDLEGDVPTGFEAGPTENAADEDVSMDPDEDLPWPVPELIAKWWAGNSKRFPAGKRHLLGQPIAPEALSEALYRGKQRQRRAAALEVAILRPDRPMFEVRARGDRQRLELRGAAKRAT